MKYVRSSSEIVMERELYAQLMEDQALFESLCKEAFDAVDVPKTGELDRTKLKSIMMEIAATYHTEMPQDEDVAKILALRSADKRRLKFPEFLEMIKELISAFLASE